MIFLYFWEEKKAEKTHTQKNYQITTGTNFAKDTGVSAKRMEIANTLHTILYKNEPTKKKHPKSKKKIEWKGRKEGKKEKYMQY